MLKHGSVSYRSAGQVTNIVPGRDLACRCTAVGLEVDGQSNQAALQVSLPAQSEACWSSRMAIALAVNGLQGSIGASPGWEVPVRGRARGDSVRPPTCLVSPQENGRNG